MLDFLPDCYGVETYWELRNEQNQLIYSVQEGFYPGGDNADEMEPNPSWSEHVWCLEDGCYTFTVYDSYGDGMNGANPKYQCGQDGDYNIYIEGNLEFSLQDANFGESVSNEFCVDQSMGASFNCVNESCIDPGDGSGMYNTLSSCENSCHTSSISEFQQSDRISRITNLLGQDVKTLVNKTMNPGTYTFNWDGKDILNSDVASGVYFYELRAESFINRKKMLLIR